MVYMFYWAFFTELKNTLCGVHVCPSSMFVSVPEPLDMLFVSFTLDTKKDVDQFHFSPIFSYNKA